MTVSPGTGRLFNHCVVHPQVDGETDLMDRWKDWCRPAGWKVYTLYGVGGQGYWEEGDAPEWGKRDWSLDDEAVGRPFLERVRDSGVRLLSAHKGLSMWGTPWLAEPILPKGHRPRGQGFP